MPYYNLPGYSIPHHFSPEEISEFLSRHANNPILLDYIRPVSSWFWQTEMKHDPPYGIVIHEPYGEILVWFDAADVLHVVDITNMSVSSEIEKAPYESPDSSFWSNLWMEYQDLFQRGANLVPAILALAAIVFIWRMTK